MKGNVYGNEWNDTVGLSRSLMTITHTRLSLVSLVSLSRLSLFSACAAEENQDGLRRTLRERQPVSDRPARQDAPV